MSSESQSLHWIAAALALRGGDDPDATQIADAAIGIWYEINTALTAVIGRQGVAALYDRSVALTARVYPWMARSRAGEDHTADLAGLQAIIARQSTDEAMKSASELLQTFYVVLISLIGPALSEQLLAAVRQNSAITRPGEA